MFAKDFLVVLLSFAVDELMIFDKVEFVAGGGIGPTIDGL